MMYSGSCPHCGAIVRYGHGDPLKRIDTPVRYCSGCGTPYMDENMYEWEVLAPESQLYYYFFANSRWALFVFSLIATFAMNHWVFLPIFVFVSMLLCYGWVHIVSHEDIEKSKVRCSSQGYVDLLAQVGYSKLDQKYTDDYRRRHKAVSTKVPATDPRPASDSSVESVPSSPPASAVKTPGFSIGRFIWIGVSFLCHKIGYEPGFHRLAYIWTAILYVIAKTMRSQALVDDIYSEFQNSAESYFQNRLRGADPVIAMRSSYRQFRRVLNESKIDPRTEHGMAALWYILSQWAFPNMSLPEEAFDYFKENCRMVLSFSKKAVERTVADSSERFSISESSPDCTLPEIN